MPTKPIAGRPWTAAEIDIAVEAYFELLQSQVAGRPIRKVDLIKAVSPKLAVRTDDSITLKFQNISAVLKELGVAPADGYSPMPHYQGALREAVRHRLFRE